MNAAIVSLGALRALVAFLLPHLVWRHHGIGVLQAYVREHVEPEVRVHIWHPSLVREGIRDHGDAHDHRFDMESTVLVGMLSETLYLVPAGPGDARARSFDVWNVENARSAGRDRGFDGECSLAEPGLILSRQGIFHREGDTYGVPRGTFHRTEVAACTRLAVTVCTMREKRGQARLLVPAGTEPVHAFGAPASDEVQRAVLAEAEAALRGNA